MRARLSLAVFATWVVLTLFASPAHAVVCGTGAGTCFVTAAGGNWNTSGTWSDTAGGVTCACTPATGDQVFATAASGNSTINANITVGAFDMNGFTGTLTHNTAIVVTVSGNDAGATNGIAFRLSAGMTFTTASGRLVQFTTTSGTASITSNGKTIGAVTVNTVGATTSLNDALTTTGFLIVTAGTFTANNQNLSIQGFSSTNTNTRVITMGSGTWTMTNTSSNVWDMGTSTNATLNANTSTILVQPASVIGEFTFAGGTGLTFNNLTVNLPTLQSVFGFLFNAGTPTFNNVSFTNVREVRLSANITMGGTLSYSGLVSSPGLLIGSGLVRNLTIASSPTLNYLTVQGINENGAGTITCNPCVDAGGNSNIVFVAASTGRPGVSPGIR